jgi:acetolactate synthase I/III small subunit
MTAIDNSKKRDIHTISMLVANKPGVLVRVSLVFARRGYNIDALAVSPAFNPNYSRMTITAQGNPDTLEQIIKQVNKLVDVLHVEEHSDVDAVHREVALLKLKATAANKAIITSLAKKFRAHIVDEGKETIIIEQTGTTDELDKLEGLLKKYGVIEMVRSGKLVMARGKETT